MSEAREFLVALAQSLASMALYNDGHPARERPIDAAYRKLQDLRAVEPHPLFTFLGDEVLFGQRPLRDFHGWEWSERLANAGIQRLEFAEPVEREEFEEFLDEVLARVTLPFVGTSEARQSRDSKIRFGSVGLKGEHFSSEDELPTATLTYSLGVEAETVKFVHDELRQRRRLAIKEAEMVVGSLSVAMHSDRQLILPLLQLRNFDEYTTTHSLNVSVLAMALGEFLGYVTRDVRTFGLAGLLHDLGKVTVPHDILIKPGKLTPEERVLMNKHPVEGARMILETEHDLDLAAVVAYEHHIMLDGAGGYPRMQFPRDCHFVSRMVHVCDVYDALRTYRPYREPWPSQKVIDYIEDKNGIEFDPDIARAFLEMMRLWDRRVAVLDSTDAPVRAAESGYGSGPNGGAAPSPGEGGTTDSGEIGSSDRD
ncbi:MAG TPA: HD domain-containing phosphohydrolase [Longimicrobiales bacterium]|nr:HD domain-containing phosphohydrolase [Longimicrobiales bacterium]